MSYKKSRPIKRIQKEILRTLLILVSVMTVLIAVISIFANIRSENRSINRNLQNMGQAVAQSQIVKNEIMRKGSGDPNAIARLYLDSLKDSLANIDVISVISADNLRIYHTNEELIGTTYDGTLPEFQEKQTDSYVTSDIGPSGSQRRAYTAIYDSHGKYIGFVLSSMLNRNINRMILNTVGIHAMCAVFVILIAILLSCHLSRKIKRLLFGYEPDVFSAMFSVRDNILESLEEGILAVGADKKVVYINGAAKQMLSISKDKVEGSRAEELLHSLALNRTLAVGEKRLGISLHPSQGADIIMDQIPVTEHGETTGVLCILRDRSEYTKIMEDLSGVRYMVESMRANNHDFTNKLHVILGLIQMGNLTEAGEYISHITTIQQNVIQNIVKNIEDPSVAALLIGKYARAAELNIQFKIKNESKLSREDIFIPSGDLVTVVGNLLENAMDSLNEKEELPKDLTVGIFTQPHAMLISVDDTGLGIPEEKQEEVFENGYTTKGNGHGTGLYVVSELARKHGGSVSFESEQGMGTSFIVTLTDEGGDRNV